MGTYENMNTFEKYEFIKYMCTYLGFSRMDHMNCYVHRIKTGYEYSSFQNPSFEFPSFLRIIVRVTTLHLPDFRIL